MQIYSLSENAVTIEFGNQINEGILQKVQCINQLINQNPFSGFITAVPAYSTLTIFYEPLQVISSAELSGAGCFEKVSGYLTGLKSKLATLAATENATVSIPVCYQGEFGPDMDELTRLHKLTADEIIELHSSAVYKVYMIGFVPGFAYLGGLSPILATPRKESPSMRVPAGAVGIAGNQTGIYPLATPGGWQLIGRTPIKLFDATLPQPSFLKTGDNVVFKPIDSYEFHQLAS